MDCQLAGLLLESVGLEGLWLLLLGSIYSADTSEQEGNVATSCLTEGFGSIGHFVQWVTIEEESGLSLFCIGSSDSLLFSSFW